MDLLSGLWMPPPGEGSDCVPRPGVLMYFDVMPLLKFLTLEQKGMLLDAILFYGQDHSIPDFGGDEKLGMIWGLIAPRIDLDGEAYNMKIEQKRYAAFCRERKRYCETPPSFDEWRLLPEDQR